jgi:hypothetical protein
MIKLKMKIPLILGGIALTSGVMAQTVDRSVVASNGGSFVGSTHSIDWTIGEPCSETYQFSGRAITQGFHQPDVKLASIQNYDEKEGNLFIYPNPVYQTLNVNFESLPIGFYIGEIYDMRGSQIRSFKIKTEEKSQTVQIELGNLMNAEYVLNIRSTDNKFFKSIKILYLNPY